jgi:hypothetical protein
VRTSQSPIATATAMASAITHWSRTASIMSDGFGCASPVPRHSPMSSTT